MLQASPLTALELEIRFKKRLPPRRVGVNALSDLAADLRALAVEQDLAPGAAGHVLAISYGGAIPFLCRVAQTTVDRLPEQDAEDIVMSVGVRLESLFQSWKGERSFAAYLHTILRNEGLRAIRRMDRQSDGGDIPAPARAEEEPASASMKLLANRRFLWFIYASPDNKKCISYTHALADFEAFSSRLEGRTYADLARFNQPRPREWGTEENGDTQWWRNRAKEGHRHLKEKLERPKYKAFFEFIYREIGGEP